MRDGIKGEDRGDEYAVGVCSEGSPALTKWQGNRQLKQAYGQAKGAARTNARKGGPIADQGGAGARWPSARVAAGGLFKLSKAIFFTAVGAGAMDLMNKNISAVVMHVVDVLRIDPERHFVGVLMEHVGLIQPQTLRRAGILSLLYAVVCVVEGTGLILEKRWAEYFTVTLTALALPWESYELIEKYSPYKVGLLVVNLAVLIYLVWILKKRREGGEGSYGGEGEG